jgi:predicted DsbA family dithiol-disulfide isomerase
MATPPRLYFDYVDPLSFLFERRLAAIEVEAGILVERIAFELRPPPAPLLDPGGDAWRERWVEARAAAPELELARPRLIPWTRKAHELAHEARERGAFDPVHRALFEAFHLEGKDLGRVDVLLEIAVRFGMELSHTKAVLDVDRHTHAVLAARVGAERIGVEGVPALLAGDRRLLGLHESGTILALLRGA